MLMVIGTHIGISQEVEIIGKIKLPKEYVSSESRLTVTSEGSLVAAILCVKPESKPPHYTTLTYESMDLGKTWKRAQAVEFPEAADPWIIAGPNGTMVLCDISEGNAFHMKSQVYDGSQWLDPQSHGYGHDHGIVINDDENTYLVSTQNEGWNKKLYLAEMRKGQSRFGAGQALEIFNRSDFSVKQPVIVNGKLYIPIALRGSVIDSVSTKPFQNMSSWLVSYDPASKKLSTPAFMTSRSGGRHHVLQAKDETLFYAYTDVKRQRLELIWSEDTGRKWSDPYLLNDTLSSDWVNLDAMIFYENHLIVSHTERKEEGYQKYVSLVATDNSFSTKKIPVGELSKPDDSNGWVKRAWPQGGDYCSIVPAPGGSVYLLWSYAPEGRFYPVIAKIQVK